MDLGLGNLVELKRHLLAAGLVTGTTYDTVVTAIGKGVAMSFDCYCNRKFARLVGDVEIFSADRTHYFLRRAPVESVSAVALQDDTVSGWQAQTVNDVIINREDASGQIIFGTVLGVEMTKVKVTYTGGFWYDTTEDATGVQPSGSTLLPQDVKLAWLLQCQQIWNSRDKLGSSIAASPTDGQVDMGGLELIPQARMILDRYKRYQMT